MKGHLAEERAVAPRTTVLRHHRSMIWRDRDSRDSRDRDRVRDKGGVSESLRVGR